MHMVVYGTRSWQCSVSECVTKSQLQGSASGAEDCHYNSVAYSGNPVQ